MPPRLGLAHVPLQQRNRVGAAEAGDERTAQHDCRAGPGIGNIGRAQQEIVAPKEQRQAEHDRQQAADNPEGMTIGDDDRAAVIIVGQLSAHRHVGDDIERKPDTHAQHDRCRVDEERHAVETGGNGEQEPERDRDGERRREHVGMAPAPARLRVVGGPADERIDERIDDECGEGRRARKAARKTAHGRDVEEVKGGQRRVDDGLDERAGLDGKSFLDHISHALPRFFPCSCWDQLRRKAACFHRPPDQVSLTEAT